MWLNILKIRRLSWIVQVGPKCNHWCAYKKKADNILLVLKDGGRDHEPRCKKSSSRNWKREGNEFSPRASPYSGREYGPKELNCGQWNWFRLLTSRVMNNKCVIISNHKLVVICYSSNSRQTQCHIHCVNNQESLRQKINITSGSRAVSAGGFRLTYTFVVKVKELQTPSSSGESIDQPWFPACSSEAGWIGHPGLESTHSVVGWLWAN